MATRIEIEGLGVVEVDDSFRSKTPDEQNAIVADIKRQVLASQSPKTDSSLSTAVQYGDLSTQAGTKQYLSDVLGNTPGTIRSGFNSAVDAVRGAVVNPVREAIGLDAVPPQQQIDKAAADQLAQQAASARAKRDALNYAPEIGSVSDIGGVGDLGQFVLERGASSFAPMVAAAATGGALGLVNSAGSVNEELRQIPGLDTDTRLALSSVAGGIIGTLDNVSLGVVLKGLPASTLAKLGAPQIAEYLASKGIGPAALKTILAGASEGSTEMIQEGVQMGAAAIGGKDFAPGEVGSRLAESGLAGAGIGSGMRGTIAATAKTGETVGNASRFIRDISQEREVKNQAPEQTASDLRVGRMFDDMKASQAKANTGTAQADDVTFKKVQDRISAEIKTAVSQLYQSDQIDKATHDRLIGRKDNILKQADQHNRDLSQEDIDVLESLPLEAPVKQGLVEAFRDLNTITNAGMKKNARGPIERLSRVALPVAAGVMAPPTMGGSLAALAGKGVVISGARKLDNILGLQQPEILRRIRVAQRRTKAGTPVGDTMHFLSDLGANAQAGVNVQTQAAAKETASQRLLRAKRRLQDNPGLNGFDRYIYDQTGLLPTEVDKGLLKLTSDGTITPAQQKAFYQAPKALREGNQGNVIMDMLNDMAVKGDLKRDGGWKGLRPEALPNAQQGGTEGIRNIYAYRQAMSNVADATTTAQQSAPSAELRQAVNDIANAPTPQAKAALFAQVRAANPEQAQWLDSVVAPITKFGPKNGTAPEAAAPAPTNVGGGGLGVRPSPIGTIPGAPSKLGPALAPDGSLASGSGAPVIKDTVGRTMSDLERHIPPAERVASQDPTKLIDGRDFSEANLDESGPGFLPERDLGKVGAEALVDKLWNDSIAESGTAATKAVKETGIRPPTADFINGALKHNNRIRYWYELSGNIFRKAFNVPGLPFSKIVDAVAGTSGGVEPYPNMKRAISILAEDFQKRPIRTDLRDPDSARKALGDTDIDSLKFGNFAGTMRYVAGDNVPPPLSTNDTQVSSAFGVQGNAFAQAPVLYEVVSRFYNKLRDEQNSRLRLADQPYESWQMQALTWVEERGRKAERKVGVSDDYAQALPRVLEEIKAAGIPLPNGQITAETLSDPRLPNLMSSTRAGFLDTYWATVETMTKLTPEGKAAYELAQRIKDQPWADKAMGDLEAIQRRAMATLAKRRNVTGEKTSIITDLFQAILGGRYEVSRIDPYGYGTFEGDVSPNMRIPTLTRVPAKPWKQLNAEQRQGVLAVLGKHLNQAAMASSKFTETTADQADTFTVFVQNYDGNVDLSTVTDLERSLGYPLNVEQVPNGYTIDINVGGFDTKPTLDGVREAVRNSPLGNRDYTIIPMKYDSDFIMEDQYDDLIKKVKQDARKALRAWELQKANRSGSGKGLPTLASVIKAIDKVARQRDKELAEWTAENERRSEREEVKRSKKGALSQ